MATDARPLAVLRNPHTIVLPPFELPGSRRGDLYCGLELRAAAGQVIPDIGASLERELRGLLETAGRDNPPAPLYASQGYPYRFDGNWKYGLLRFFLPAEAGIGPDELSPFLHGLANAVGLRANTLAAMGLLTYGVRHTVNPYLGGSPLSETLRIIADIQAVWAPELDRLLNFDVAAGTQKYPELVRAMHLDHDPLEFAILWCLLRQAHALRARGHMTNLYNYNPPRFAQATPAQVLAAAAHLSNEGWIEGFKYDPVLGVMAMGRGEKLRKLAARDALALWW
jgi:hypothetical protein